MIKQILIISGKGGTGKTILTASFAVFAKNKVMADCDVDAANLHLLLHPDIQESHNFVGGQQARHDPEKCTLCGACRSVCQYNAISTQPDQTVTIDALSCEGCGVCAHICPVQAMFMEDNVSGEWYISSTRYGPFVHARLGIGEENSGKLVAEVRKRALELAKNKNKEFVIIDGPPGIGCPVIASLSGVDLAIVVTEPSLSSMHDMERVLKTADHFKIKTACCINKHDINPSNTRAIEQWCKNQDITLIGKIPFSEEVHHAVVQGIPLPELPGARSSEIIARMWQKVLKLTKRRFKL